MAIEKSIIKINHNLAVVKIVSTGNAVGRSVINLSTDLLLPANETTSGTCKVHITQLYWSVARTKNAVVSRNDAGLDKGQYFLTDTGNFRFNSFRDTSHEDGSIAVDFDGDGMVILALSKEQGYVLQ